MKNKISRILLVVFGAAVAGYAVSCIYIPNKIVSGGISGIATILYYVAGIEPGFTSLAVNGVLLLLAWFKLGKNFVLKTVCGTAIFTFFVQMFMILPPLTNDVVLATVLGAIFYGIGIGTVLVSGFTTGGTDIISRIFQQSNPNMPIGTLIAFVNGGIILTSLIIFKNINLTLYGVVALVLSSTAINMLIRKLNVSRLIFVVTEYGYKIADIMLKESSRGITILPAEGAYTLSRKNILMCVIKESEMALFQKRVSEIDENAFIIFSEAQQIDGNGFRIYR